MEHDVGEQGIGSRRGAGRSEGGAARSDGAGAGQGMPAGAKGSERNSGAGVVARRTSINAHLPWGGLPGARRR